MDGWLLNQLHDDAVKLGNIQINWIKERHYWLRYTWKNRVNLPKQSK